MDLVVTVGVLRLTLYLPENHSLKGKRSVLRTIKARVRNKFNVSIAEAGDHDTVNLRRAHADTADGETGEPPARAYPDATDRQPGDVATGSDPDSANSDSRHGPAAPDQVPARGRPLCALLTGDGAWLRRRQAPLVQRRSRGASSRSGA